MKRLMIATAATALTAGTAMAAVELDALDMDADTFASVEEVKAAFPNMDIAAIEAIDTNDDNRLSAQEVQTLEAQEQFGLHDMVPLEQRFMVRLDTDYNGYIEADEVAAQFSDFDQEDFERMDTNGDNRLTYQEWYAPEAVKIVAGYRQGTIKDIAEIDMNGDSFADFNEMVASFPGLSEIDFDEIDQNDDNRVSSQELYELDAQEIISRSAS